MTTSAFRCLQLPVDYLPWSIGGREVYAHSLATNLERIGWDAQVSIHAGAREGMAVGRTRFEDIDVHVLPPIEAARRRESAYSCLPDRVPGFAELLAEFRPRIVHFHDFSIAANRLHLRAARASGAGIVMSYHTPGQSCTQRSLLYRGKTVCDGEIRAVRCTRCRLAASGASLPVASLLAFMPGIVDPESPSSLARALSGRTMTDAFIDGWTECLELVDRFHVSAAWSADMLVRNGVSPAKIVKIPMSAPNRLSADRRITKPSGPNLELIFVGRCSPEKGIDVLVDAVKKLPRDAAIRVSFFGPAWNDTDYGRNLLAAMAGDIRFNPPTSVPPDRILETMQQYDACVVPSLWLETGPFVVLEAREAGLPVLGSHLGGIAEKVRDGVDGLLFEPGNSAALAALLARVLDDRSQLPRPKSGESGARTFADVAADVDRVYRTII